MTVQVSKYHLFKRRLETGTFWYYWFYDEAGKRIQRACGYRCKNKRDAVAFLENLLKQELSGIKQKTALQNTLLGDYAKDMFIEGAAHLELWKAKGYILKPQTISQHRRHLMKYLIPRFGKLPLDKIFPVNVEDFLLEQRLSNSCRNTINLYSQVSYA